MAVIHFYLALAAKVSTVLALSGANAATVVGAFPAIFIIENDSAITGLPSYHAVPLNAVWSSKNNTSVEVASCIPRR